MSAKQKPSSESPKEVIYVDLDDEITVVFAQAKRARLKNIALIVPNRAQLLTSLTNLKILAAKISQLEKNVTIVTLDQHGRQLAASAGFATAEKIKIRGTQVQLEGQTRQAVGKALKPKLTKLNRKKLPVEEVSDEERQKFQEIERGEIPLSDPVSGVRGFFSRLRGGVAEVITDDDNHLVVRPPNRRILFVLLSAALALLFFVVYVAVPTATVYIIPRADPLSRTVNVSLVENISTTPVVGADTSHEIGAKFYDFEFETEIRVGTTGQIFDGENATGTVTLYNRSPKEKFIVPSRLQSARDDLIFHTTRALTIPGAVGDIPGELTAEVTACEKDDTRCDCINAPETCDGNFVGAKGNIEPAYFVLPAIPSLSPSLYWAESSEAFTGGVTRVIRYVTGDDLENVRDTISLDVDRIAHEKLIEAVASTNLAESRNLVLLEKNKALDAQLIDLAIPTEIQLEDQLEEFTVTARIRTRGVAFDVGQLQALLAEQLATKVHPEKLLTKIDFENAALRVENLDFDTDFVRLSATVSGVEEYDLAALSESGTTMTEKIRTRILGRDIREAESYIRNLPEINNVNISSWPFWAQTVPELPENVSFKTR